MQPYAARSGRMSGSVDYSWTGSWTVSPGQTRSFWRARQPASGHSSGVEAAPDHSAVPLAARSPLVGRSTTATDPAGVVPGRRGGARRGTAGTDLAGTPRRPSPVHRTVRSTDAPPAPCGPGDSCPAPTAPNPAQASAPGPVTAHSQGNGTAHHSAAAVPSLKAPYREGRQSDSPGVGREPDGTSGAAVRQRGQKRRGRCSQQPTTDDTRPRYSEAPSPCGLGLRAHVRVTRTRATTLRSCD